MTRNDMFRWVRCGLFWACAAVLAYWSVDRTPPFTLLSYSTEPVKRGGTALIKANVVRDVTRGCTVTYSRFLFDSRGFRYDLNEQQRMTAEAIKSLDKITPNVLSIAVPIPQDISVGRALFQSVLHYTCNPLQLIFPITVFMEVDFTILE